MSDFAYYVFGQEPAVAVHLALWYVLLVCHQYDVCENYDGSVYVGGYCGLSESGLCVFCKLCPVGFLVVGQRSVGFVVVCSPCRMLIVVIMVSGLMIVRVELSTMSGCKVC